MVGSAALPVSQSSPDGRSTARTDPTRAALTALRDEFGVRTLAILNGNEQGVDRDAEVALAASMGLEPVLFDWIGMLEERKLGEEPQWQRLLGLIERGALYLHCIWGVDRTGATVARARCEVQGWSAADAFGELRAYGFAFQLKRRRLERYHRDVLAYFGFRLSGYAPLTPDHPDHVACRVREATYIGDPDD